MKVRVEGRPQYLNLILTDPDGIEISRAWITEDDLLDGIETVKLKMANYGETPKGGIYTLIIKKSYGDVLFTKKLSFNGANVSINEVRFEYQYWERFKDCKYTIEKIKLNISNNGDLPAIVDRALVTIDGDVVKVSFYPRKALLPNSTNKVEEPFRIAPPFCLKLGTYKVVVGLYSEKKLLTSYETEITLKK